MSQTMIPGTAEPTSALTPSEIADVNASRAAAEATASPPPLPAAETKPPGKRRGRKSNAELAALARAKDAPPSAAPAPKVETPAPPEALTETEAKLVKGALRSAWEAGNPPLLALEREFAPVGCQAGELVLSDGELVALTECSFGAVSLLGVTVLRYVPVVALLATVASIATSRYLVVRRLVNAPLAPKA